MYATFAERLLDIGWGAPLPVRRGEKAPAIAGWQVWNRHRVTAEAAALWARQYPSAGIGMAAGHGAIYLDLDHLEPGAAATIRAAADALLGETPLIRIGRWPKTARVYAAQPGSAVATAAWPRLGVQVFATTGQMVFHGMHPITGQPYRWPEALPEELGPGDIPAFPAGALPAFLTAAATALGLPPEAAVATARPPAWGGAWTGSGGSREVLRALAEGERRGQPLEGVVAALAAAAGEGARHFTMLALVQGLIERGLSDANVHDLLARHWVTRFGGTERRARDHALRDAIRWFRRRLGPDAAVVDRLLGADAWGARR